MYYRIENLLRWMKEIVDRVGKGGKTKRKIVIRLHSSKASGRDRMT